MTEELWTKSAIELGQPIASKDGDGAAIIESAFGTICPIDPVF
ncbi:MAG: hypothetical protein VB957_08220 [Pseudomonadales bacterium]|jgi:hypothetical protein